MKRIVSLSFVCLFVLLIFSSIAEARRIRGSGNIVRETREIRGVDGVELATIGTLIIEIGDKEELVIEAEDNLIKYFDTDVSGGMLSIDRSGRVIMRPTEPIRFYLTVRELTEIEISSSGDVKAHDIKADRFQINIGSSGDVEMGDLTVKSLDITINSSGDVKIRDVTARDVEIDVSSSGDVTIESLNEAKLLIVDINSSGDVAVRGGEVNELEVSIGSSGDFNGKRLQCREADVSLGSSGDATIRVSEYLRAQLGSSGDLYYIGDPEIDKSVGASGRVKHIR